MVAKFDGGTMTSDGGVLLLGAVEQRIKLLGRFAECFIDGRDARFVEHPVRHLVSQRVLGLALGYEDLNDHDALRRDPVLAAVVGAVDVAGTGRRRSVDRGCALAGKSTLNRLELSTESEDRYKKIQALPARMDELLLRLFIESFRRPPKSIVLDVDATDDPLHGQQEGRFFHGYYGNYCYLPLYIFCGEQLLCARLRTSNQDAAAGTQEELARIVSGLRAVWPKVQIVLRGDSGFCRDGLLSWCESEGVDYIVGLAKNSRLKRAIGQPARAAEQEHQQTLAPARRFHAFAYRTRKSWSTSRWVIGKAEHLSGGANPRFIVTTLLDSTSAIALTEQGRRLYEQVYCARGEMENRIKEQQLYLFADRTSAATMRANQLRLYFSSFAYCLLQALRRLALKGTVFAKAQCHTLREKLLKIGARIRITARKLWVSLPTAYPYRDVFSAAFRRLQDLPLRI
jgi:hypothetical protein